MRIIGLLTDTAKLYITPKDISIKAIDKAKVALANINIGKSVFDKYNATTFELGLDLDRIRKIIDLAKANELVDIQFFQERNQLVVTIGELKALMGIVDFRDIPDSKPEIIEESGKVILKADQLKRGLIVSDDIAEDVVLGIDRNKFLLKAEKDANAVELRLIKSDLLELESEVYHESGFSCKYLKDLFQCLNDESVVQICFGSETLLRIDYDFPYPGSHLTYFLCPRIESC